MQCITNDEVELIRTFALFLKMKNYEKTINGFKEKFETHPDRTNAFHYGLCMSIFAIIDTNDSDKPKHIQEMNRAFEACLEFTPDWWLVRYLRSEINEGGSDETMEAFNLPVFERITPAEDRRILMEQQKAHEGSFSYFLCPYIAQVRSATRSGDLDGAMDIYKAGVANVSITKSPYDFSYLTHPFYDTIVYFRKLEMIDIADEIKQRAIAIFPNSKKLLMA
jgi:hypothetical protein